MYTIGQISEMFNIPVSTLRYYDREGLFPNMKRESNIRKFDDSEIETLRIIECLKKSGMEIKDIRRYMELCSKGSSTYAERKALFEKQRESVEGEIARLEKTLNMLKFKCWYYDQAIADGNEEHIREMLPDKLPADIQAVYDNAHEK
ncbi:transcriptional regulator MerR family [Firmicutes bacterium CAG:882]|nr:transcriptional regulator MerR family [Firmicutes bacterium CAG:882]